ncbi:MAG: ABC transporter permease [Desulfobacteraceae bacterium]|nr:ABC transporter permease [Desulfobacteraceae bacterium]
MKLIWQFLVRDIRNHFSYRLAFTLQFINIVPVVIMFFYLSRLVDQSVVPDSLEPYGGKYFPFVLVGIAFQNYLSVALMNFSASIREAQLSGTLETVMASPISLPVFLMGSTAYSFVFNAIRILLFLACGAFLFHFPISLTQLLLASIILILTIGAFSSLGILSAAFILIFKKGDPINWLINVSSWLLGGVYYPVNILPDWMQRIAAAIPMTHSLEAFRQCFLGTIQWSSMGFHLGILTVWAAIGLPISFLCFRYALDHCRMAGSRAHY